MNNLLCYSEAAKYAAQSDYKSVHIGCVAVYKNGFICGGYNSTKTHPKQMRYNRYRNIRDAATPMMPTLHAEIDCINQLKRANVDYSKVKLYIYRELKDGRKGMCRPCPACMRAIKDLGIRQIYYTTESGYAFEMIDGAKHEVCEN